MCQIGESFIMMIKLLQKKKAKNIKYDQRSHFHYLTWQSVSKIGTSKVYSVRSFRLRRKCEDAALVAGFLRRKEI